MKHKYQIEHISEVFMDMSKYEYSEQFKNKLEKCNQLVVFGSLIIIFGCM